MNELLYYLLKLEEESAEVIKEASKCALFGLRDVEPGTSVPNKERCHRELNDLLAVIDVLNEKFDFNFTPDPEQIELKKRKMAVYLQYARDRYVSDPT